MGAIAVSVFVCAVAIIGLIYFHGQDKGNSRRTAERE